MATTAICLAGLPIISTAMETNSGETFKNAWVEFNSRVADIWGSDNIWVPQPKVCVQYEADLGERSAVDFEKGVASLQVILKATDNPHSQLVLDHLHQGVGNLVLGQAQDPIETMKKKLSRKRLSRMDESLYQQKESQPYLVVRGDTLWDIARRVRMTTQDLAALNGMTMDTILPVGHALKVKVYGAHDLTLDPPRNTPAKDPLLLDQILMADGRKVSQSLIRDFAMEVVENHPPSVKKVTGADGIERQVVTIKFKLASNHLEIRARKFYPLVQVHAAKHAFDPAMVMAIIHTESMFNTRARSRIPAYGLMQLVPHSGGSEAYHRVYGKKRKLTSRYLYNPKNNIELGVAYLSILKNRYMGKIVDDTSRTYCAVAAYNAGAANVGRAFVPKKSMARATPVINSLGHQEVYDRLVAYLPFKESRKYVHKVLNRTHIYQRWH
jgi:membrane-bound lytic murein transglycosylase C